ncbi:MAG: aminotransferase class V-fold PLP-dependent enzyme [bacterium]
MNAVETIATGFASNWGLEPGLTFLNHGSFGACPKAVLAVQAEFRARLERDPARFMARDFEDLVDEARAVLAAFLGADEEDLAFLHNATTAVSTVLRSISWHAGDEILITDNAYNACANAAREIAGTAGAHVAVASIPFPGTTADAVMDAVLSRVTPRTRLALLDHITSPTALVLPIERLIRELAARGVDTFVDGAHAPGQVPLDLGTLGAAYYTGNCHKWLCAPKGAGFLWVERSRQATLRPLVVSHGANSPRTDRSRFRLEFDWLGTDDPTAFLAVPAALKFLGSLVAGGWPALRARNHALVVEGRRVLCEALAVDSPCDEALLGSMASIPLPDARGPRQLHSWGWDPLQERLRDDDRIDTIVNNWPAWPKRLLRLSAQLYNEPADYARLATALVAQLRRESADAPSS